MMRYNAMFVSEVGKMKTLVHFLIILLHLQSIRTNVIPSNSATHNELDSSNRTLYIKTSTTQGFSTTQESSTTPGPSTTSQAKEQDPDDHDSVIAKRASLIVALGFVPGTICLYILCTFVPRWFEKYYENS
ncbi:uncharacterized protein LOC130656247 [Hydractinia symbiolongicarpus]|uniref:uncharacterized protein LOC130656247 n=1 Tax=Hydractinia symbiolongicarpus TaxID=13093 RepID=UPI00254C4145|nr:uncharacterized protein LOC130656247 [Hydractinia symbiolongicarpus]